MKYLLSVLILLCTLNVLSQTFDCQKQKDSDMSSAKDDKFIEYVKNAEAILIRSSSLIKSWDRVEYFPTMNECNQWLRNNTVNGEKTTTVNANIEGLGSRSGSYTTYYRCVQCSGSGSTTGGYVSEGNRVDVVTGAAISAVDMNDARSDVVKNTDNLTAAAEYNKGNVRLSARTPMSPDLSDFGNMPTQDLPKKEIPCINIGVYQGQDVCKKGDTIIVAATNQKYLLQEQSMDEGYSYLLDEYNIPKGTFVIEKDIQGRKQVIGYVTTKGYTTNSTLMTIQNEYAKNSNEFKFYEKLREIGQYQTSKVYFRESTQTIHIGRDKYLLSQQKLPSDLKIGGIPDGNNIRIVCLKEGAQSYSEDDIIGYVSYTGNQYAFTEINRNGCSELVFQQDLNTLNKYAQVLFNPDQTVDFVNKACEDALREHLKKYPLTLFKFIANQNTIPGSSEQAILRIMKCLDPQHYPEFFNLLEANNNEIMKILVGKLNDKTLRLFGENNYTSFIKELIRMYDEVPDYWLPRFAEIGNDKLLGQVINLNPMPFTSDMKSSFSPFSSTEPLNEFSFIGRYNDDGTVSIYREENVSYGGTTSSGVWNHSNNVGISDRNPTLANLKPLDPVVILTDKELPIVKTALEGEEVSNNVYVVPAIFFQYRGQKEFNQTLWDAGAVMVDIASIYLTAGSSALATKAHWIRKVWAWAEIAGSLGDIANKSGITNEQVGKVFDAFNDGLFYISVTGYLIPQKSLNVFIKGPMPRTVGAIGLNMKDNRSLSSSFGIAFSGWQNAAEKLNKTDLTNKNDVNKLKKQYEFYLSCGVINEADEKIEKIKKLLFSNISEITSIKDAQNNPVEAKQQMKTPNGHQTITFATLTLLISTTGDKFQAQSGDKFVGEMKDGKVVQGQGQVYRNNAIIYDFPTYKRNN